MILTSEETNFSSFNLTWLLSWAGRQIAQMFSFSSWTIKIRPVHFVSPICPQIKGYQCFASHLESQPHCCRCQKHAGKLAHGTNALRRSLGKLRLNLPLRTDFGPSDNPSTAETPRSPNFLNLCQTLKRSNKTYRKKDNQSSCSQDRKKEKPCYSA